ncbi:site-2 protease family protein [Marinilactibacillus sp. Marseille-P9653]|uniref:site-2 protease family protein n=1 Tax=Marinilactibacillus sp. Marseille-P9653 TaxID=2866583 RepID=UPI001CE49CBE|nr:site-2 protease family protein [Marinilactibacillus sp. Marseille-P9653]
MKKVLITLYIAIFAVIGFWIGYHATMTDLDIGWLLIRAGLILISIAVFGFLHIIIHEMGHLIAGKVSGYQFSFFRIANWALVKEQHQYRIAKFSIAGTGGQCLMIPAERDDNPPYRLYLFGGALANFITAAIGLVFVLIGFRSVYLYSFILTGLFTGILNLIPFSITDGNTLKRLKMDPNKRPQLFQQLRLSGDFINGKMYGEIKDHELIENPNEPMTEQFNAYTVLVQINRELEAENFGHALELIEPLWNQRLQMVKPYQMEISRDYLFCHLTMETEDTMIQDEIKEDPLFQQYLKTNQLETYRIKAAMAFWIDKDLNQAENWLEKAEKSLDQAPTYADRALNKKLLDFVEQKVTQERVNRTAMKDVEEELV